MFGRIKNKKKVSKSSKVKLAIDIGTHAVKTALFREKGRDVEILGYSRVNQRLNAMYKALIRNTDEVLDVVDKGIGMVIESARAQFEDVELPESCIVGIAGELVSGVPVIVNIERENPDENIIEDELVHIIHKVKQYTFENTIQEIAEESGLEEDQIVEVGTYIDSMYVDDVKVGNPVGLRGSVLTCRVYASFAPKVHYDSIVKIVNSLNLKLERVVVEPYALAISLDGIRSTDDGAIFIDIGGGTTDVAVVSGGEVIGTKMFGIGGNLFTQRIAKDLKISFQEAEDLKIEYIKNLVDKPTREKMVAAIAKDLQLWITGIEISLEEFEGIKHFPKNIYVCGGGCLLPEIMETLLEYPWKTKFPFTRHPSINFYYPNKVSNVIDRTKNIKNPEDVTPITLARTSIEF